MGGLKTSVADKKKKEKAEPGGVGGPSVGSSVTPQDLKKKRVQRIEGEMEACRFGVFSKTKREIGARPTIQFRLRLRSPGLAFPKRLAPSHPCPVVPPSLGLFPGLAHVSNICGTTLRGHHGRIGRRRGVPGTEGG